MTTYTCSVCGYSYSEEGDLSPDLHDYSVVEAVVYPGCTFAGENRVSCSRCGVSYTVEAPATGHNYVVSASVPASCLADGYRTYACSGCGDSYTETLNASGHQFAGATCSTPETCVLCGETRGEALGHHPGKCEYCGAIIPYTAEEFDYSFYYESFGNLYTSSSAPNDDIMTRRYDPLDPFAHYTGDLSDVFKWDYRPAPG